MIPWIPIFLNIVTIVVIHGIGTVAVASTDRSREFLIALKHMKLDIRTKWEDLLSNCMRLPDHRPRIAKGLWNQAQSAFEQQRNSEDLRSIDRHSLTVNATDFYFLRRLNGNGSTPCLGGLQGWHGARGWSILEIHCIKPRKICWGAACATTWAASRPRPPHTALAKMETVKSRTEVKWRTNAIPSTAGLGSGK